MRTFNVLVVDDDPNIRKLLGDLLGGRQDFRVLIAGSGKEAVKFFAEERIDVVLTDIHMPGFTGLELMADMRKIKFKPEILVMTANATPENVETARKIGARSVILKPFDNLDIVEGEIDKAIKAVAAAGEGGNGGAPDPPPPRRAPEPMAPRRAAPQPPPRPAPAARSPAGPRSAVPARAPIPTEEEPEEGIAIEEEAESEDWTDRLTANDTPPPAPVRSAPPVAPGRPVAPRMPANPAPVARERGPEASEVFGGAAPSPRSAALEIPQELDDILKVAESLDAGKMKMQVPIVALRTWEEQSAAAALQPVAGLLNRQFFTWSATRGITKEDGQQLGEVYRDPIRALDFIRRQKERGLYLLADFGACLQDRGVVRTLREMVMGSETARAFLVLTDPKLSLPTELEPACALFEWPAGSGQDLEALYEEVRGEIESSTARPLRLGDAERLALLEKVKEMPAGRARFEIARALMARAGRR